MDPQQIIYLKNELNQQIKIKNLNQKKEKIKKFRTKPCKAGF